LIAYSFITTQATQVDWRLTTEDARIKIKRLYPSYPLVLRMSHFVGAGLPTISLAHPDIDKPAPTNPLIITKFAM
jgi:hypothetical protein